MRLSTHGCSGKRQIFTQLSLVEEAGVHLCCDFILQKLLFCVLFTAIVMSSSLMLLFLSVALCLEGRFVHVYLFVFKICSMSFGSLSP